jgi:uncharacterized protein YidB (DUF937 family)
MSGLLGNILGSVLGGQQGGGNPMMDIVGGLLSNDGGQGGLGGLVEKFSQAGAGDLIQSWIGKGENLPISPEMLQNILGSDAVAGMASKLGVDPSQAAGQLSEMLPGLIDKLTPGGEAPAGGLGGLGDMAGMLGGLLKR